MNRSIINVTTKFYIFYVDNGNTTLILSIKKITEINTRARKMKEEKRDAFEKEEILFIS